MIPVKWLLAVKQNKNPWRNVLYRSMVFQYGYSREKMYIRFGSTLWSFTECNVLAHLRTIMLSGAVASCLQQEKLALYLCIWKRTSTQDCTHISEREPDVLSTSLIEMSSLEQSVTVLTKYVLVSSVVTSYGLRRECGRKMRWGECLCCNCNFRSQWDSEGWLGHRRHRTRQKNPKTFCVGRSWKCFLVSMD